MGRRLTVVMAVSALAGLPSCDSQAPRDGAPTNPPRPVPDDPMAEDPAKVIGAGDTPQIADAMEAIRQLPHGASAAHLAPPPLALPLQIMGLPAPDLGAPAVEPPPR